jgi:hypothetical protein
MGPGHDDPFQHSHEDNSTPASTVMRLPPKRAEGLFPQDPPPGSQERGGPSPQSDREGALSPVPGPPDRTSPKPVPNRSLAEVLGRLVPRAVTASTRGSPTLNAGPVAGSQLRRDRGLGSARGQPEDTGACGPG